MKKIERGIINAINFAPKAHNVYVDSDDVFIFYVESESGDMIETRAFSEGRKIAVFSTANSDEDAPKTYWYFDGVMTVDEFKEYLAS